MKKHPGYRAIAIPLPKAHPRMRILLLLAIASALAFIFPFPADAAKCSLRLTDSASVSGNLITHVFSLKNTGSGSCVNASISVYYGNETYVSSSLQSAASNYYWRAGTLARGGTYALTVTTQAKEAGTVITEACAAANGAKDSCIKKTVSASAVPIDPPPPQPAATGEYGIWIWDSPYAMTFEKSKSLIDSVASYGFNAIYITVDDYLPIASMSEGTAKEEARALYDAAVEKFIVYAHGKGIAVDAEGGAPDWIYPDKRENAYAILDYAATYNAAHAERFRNVQYDVEPYILPEYETNKASVLTAYAALVSELTARDTTALGLSIVIPHFYDLTEWTPTISYGGFSGSAYSVILSTLDQKPGNSLTVMAYRNFAEGANGTLDIAGGEIREASVAGHQSKVIVAQETGNVAPSYVTFYGTSKSYLESQIAIIKDTFQGLTAFGGIAIHYIDPFLLLR